MAWNSTGSAAGATPDDSWLPYYSNERYPPSWTNQPCHEGHRLPTDKEFENLLGNTTVSNGGCLSEYDYAYKTFIYKNDLTKRLEFPAVGWHDGSNGSLKEAGVSGHYWSSVTYSPNSYLAYELNFNNSNPIMFNHKTNGQSVRCVHQ